MQSRSNTAIYYTLEHGWPNPDWLRALVSRDTHRGLRAFQWAGGGVLTNYSYAFDNGTRLETLWAD